MTAELPDTSENGNHPSSAPPPRRRETALADLLRQTLKTAGAALVLATSIAEKEISQH